MDITRLVPVWVHVCCGEKAVTAAQRCDRCGVVHRRRSGARRRSRPRIRLLLVERDQSPWADGSDPYSAGNGSLMRLAPVPLFYAHDPRLAIEQAAASSRTTPGQVEAVDACRDMAGLIAGAMNGASRADLLRTPFAPIDGIWSETPLTPAIARVAQGSFLNAAPPVIRGDGCVTRCLEAAPWTFAKSTSFEDGALLAVNLGEDADTTGAAYGQLAGACYGVNAIPQRWRDRLAIPDLVERCARRLYDAALAARHA
jgi:ADP-ribosylglycohydrolase